jgi:hypothetical protein
MSYPGTRWNTASGSDTSFGSDTLALSYVEDLANAANLLTPTPFTVAATHTMTTAELLQSWYQITGGATAMALTMPTAAAIVAALVNCQVGSAFEVIFDNQSGGTTTITTNTGITLVGTTQTIATTVRRLYRGIVTNATIGAEAVSIFAMNTVGT